MTKLSYDIKPIFNDHKQQILDLILPIQQIEFHVPVTMEGQPDLLDIEKYYHQTGGGFWGAEHNGELIGTIALIATEHQSGTIRKMFVKKEFRGKETGIAQVLLDELIRHCQSAGITDLYLGTVDVLKAAHRFYEKNDFIRKESNEMPFYFQRMMGENVYYHRRLNRNYKNLPMNIQLRPFTLLDANALQQAADNVHIAANLRNTFPVPYQMNDAEQYIMSVSERAPQTDFVIDVDGVFAGRIALDLKDDIYSTTAEIGYWIAEPFWGKGIATKAIGKMVEYVKATFDRPRLFAVCFESNYGSRKALENNGFVLEAIRKKAVIKNGEILNDCVYIIIF